MRLLSIAETSFRLENYKYKVMRIRLFHFLIPLTFFLCSTVIAQTGVTSNKTFALFGVESANSSVLTEIETTLKSEPSFEMVRVDYSKNTVFVVSQNGITISAQSLQNLLDAKFQFIVCSQFGVLGINEINFSALFTCLDQ